MVRRVVGALEADAAREPLIWPHVDVETLAASLRASGDATLVAIDDEHLVGHLYGFVLPGAAGPEAWTGPDGWSGEASVIDALRRRAFDGWRASGVASHHVWVSDDASITGAWIEAGYRVHDVRGLRRLDDLDAEAITPTPAIRRGGAHDLEAALTFDELIDVAHHQPIAPASARRRALRELLEDPDVSHHVVEEDGRALAQCITFALEPTRATPPGTLHVSAVAVVASARRRGVARTLVRHVLAEAREEGFTHAQVTWRPDNAPANAFWSALGFRRTYARLRATLS